MIVIKPKNEIINRAGNLEVKAENIVLSVSVGPVSQQVNL